MPTNDSAVSLNSVVLPKEKDRINIPLDVKDFDLP